MTILLRIYFVGMIAFVPGEADRDMTVLLPDLRQGYLASDGEPVEPHTAFLLARSGGCAGECAGDQEPIAEMLYRGLSGVHGEPMELLHKAVREGGVWKLADSDLVIEAKQPRRAAKLRILRSPAERPGLVPASSREKQIFDWVADIGQIAPETGGVDPGLLVDRPRRGALVARLRLSGGELRTHRMVRVGDDVPALDLRTLHDDKVVFSQALAHWVVAEVPVRVQKGDCKVRLVDQNFVDGSRRRIMDLMPERCEKGGVIDVAILNVPTSSFEPVPRPPTLRDRIGRHFEVYYELTSRPPARENRPVPHVGKGPTVPSKTVQPPADEPSDFLERIVLPPAKGVANPLLCPPSQI